MTNELSVDDLWESAPSAEQVFQAADLSHLPEATQRYLEHAIAPGTFLARAMRLRMHGEIRLQRWFPFKAEQVIVWDSGFIWRATVRMFGIPIRGSDRLIDNEGSMRWRLFGIIPVVTASGPDLTRSAAGRVAGEAVWLPSGLCGDDISWTTLDSSHIEARFTAHGESVELVLAIDEKGQIETVRLQRWGNPEGVEFNYVDFGVIVEEEKTFDGNTIPTRLRAGWYFGTDRFESEGEFFRCTIDDAIYR